MRAKMAVRRKRSKFTIEHVGFICNALATEDLSSELNLTVSCAFIPLVSAAMESNRSCKHTLC